MNIGVLVKTKKLGCVVADSDDVRQSRQMMQRCMFLTPVKARKHAKNDGKEPR